MKKVTVPLLALALHQIVSGAERPNIRDVVNQRFDEMLSMARNLEARPSQTPQTTPLQDSAAREDYMNNLLNQLIKSQTELAETKVALAIKEKAYEDINTVLLRERQQHAEEEAHRAELARLKAEEENRLNGLAQQLKDSVFAGNWAAAADIVRREGQGLMDRAGLTAGTKVRINRQ